MENMGKRKGRLGNFVLYRDPKQAQKEKVEMKRQLSHDPISPGNSRFFRLAYTEDIEMFSKSL